MLWSKGSGDVQIAERHQGVQAVATDTIHGGGMPEQCDTPADEWAAQGTIAE
jgi:hypothetical protein